MTHMPTNVTTLALALFTVAAAPAAHSQELTARVLGVAPNIETVVVHSKKCVDSPDPEAAPYKTAAQRDAEATKKSTLTGIGVGVAGGLAFASKYNAHNPGLALLSIASAALWGGTVANQAAKASTGQEWAMGEAKPKPADPGPPPVAQTCTHSSTAQQVQRGWLLELRLNGQSVIAQSAEAVPVGSTLRLVPQSDGTLGFVAGH